MIRNRLKPTLKRLRKQKPRSIAVGLLLCLASALSCSVGLLDFDSSQESTSALACAPTRELAAVGQPISIVGSGGIEPYTFALTSGTGSLDTASGSYTPSQPETATFLLTDVVGTTATCSVESAQAVVELKGGRHLASGLLLFLVHSQFAATGLTVAIDSSAAVSANRSSAGPPSLWNFTLPLPASPSGLRLNSTHTLNVVVTLSNGTATSQSLSVLRDLNRDVNRDGYPDLVVGAPNESTGMGGFHLYLGSSLGFPRIPSHSTAGTSPNDGLGTSVAMIGDFNGDGFGDFAVGSPGSAAFKGKAFVYAGSSVLSAPLSPVSTLEGESVGNFFGQSVSAAGDVDSDGYDDLVVGAPEYDNVGARLDASGKAYVFLGDSNPTSPTKTEFVAPNSDPNDEVTDGHFGKVLAYAGDVNGDGVSEFLVGADRGSALDIGKVFLYSGPSILLVKRLFGALGSRFGHSVAGGLDINGDGRSDILIGAPFSNVTVSGGGVLSTVSAGKVFVLYSLGITAGEYLFTQSELQSPNPTTSERFGSAVTLSTDSDGDHIPDIVVGASGHTGDVADSGAAYVWSGTRSTSLANTPSKELSNPTPSSNAEYGRSLTCVDGNLDGFSEIVVGAPNAETSTGRVYSHTGSSSGIGSTATELSPVSSMAFGASLN